MSSRLVRSPSGRPVAVEITSPQAELEIGHRFIVLGNEIIAVEGRFRFTGEPSGRSPLAEEATESRRRGAQV